VGTSAHKIHYNVPELNGEKNISHMWPLIIYVFPGYLTDKIFTWHFQEDEGAFNSKNWITQEINYILTSSNELLEAMDIQSLHISKSKYKS